VSCRYCGIELPDGALFCGECGRAVNIDQERAPATALSSVIVPTTRSDLAVSTVDDELPAVASAGFSIADLAFSSPGDTSEPGDRGDHELREVMTLGDKLEVARCQQCGEPMREDDVFCGECGFVLRTVAPPAGDEAPQTGGSGLPTSIILLSDLITLGEFPADASASESPEQRGSEQSVFEHGGSDETTDVEPVPFGALDDLVHESPARAAATADLEVDPDLEFDEPLPLASPLASPLALPIARKPMPSPRARPIPDPFPWGTDRTLREDIEATRIIADPASGVRFVLQFSTGESVTVLGSGLVGRNPSMQPGEYVDQLVPIFDAGKSVSKTHLEYGQEAGRFWISDRYSTNGSTIRQPDAEPRRADPGHRYFVARGTRIDVGEQFFVVS
jgi:uncharacterized Zn finger protein (UPF0148 family)